MGRKKKFSYYPIYVDIEDRDVLIVGGGNVCARKAETMMRYGARVTVIASSVSDEIRGWAAEGRLALSEKKYHEHDLEGRSLVIASTDDPCINARVARDCRRRRIPVNVVDVTHLCEFIVPAIVEQGSIQIAVSTGGKSPALARTIRETLERTIGREFSEMNDLLGSLRVAAKETLATDIDRKKFFDSIVASDAMEHLRKGDRTAAYDAIARLCNESAIPVSPEVEKLRSLTK